MKQEMITQVTSLLIQIFITAILPVLSYKLFKLFEVKKAELLTKMDRSDYELLMQVAKSIYFIIEEKFKNFSGYSDKKKEQFDELLVSKFPFLQPTDIDHIRQAVVGEYNKLKSLPASIQPEVKITEKQYETTNSVVVPVYENPQVVPPNCVSEIPPIPPNEDIKY